MKASTSNLWAPLVTPARGKPWIRWDCLARLRKDARESYFGVMTPAARKKWSKCVRFVRVTVTEQ